MALKTAFFLLLALIACVTAAAVLPPPAAARQGDTLRHILLEENDPASEDGTFYARDPIVVRPLLDLMLPGDCAASQPIPTGMTVAIAGADPYPEHVCTVPGCSYISADEECRLNP